MLSDDIFTEGIELLNLHFSKQIHEKIIPIWKEYLDSHLSDDEFTVSIKEAIVGCQYFPTAKQLVEFAQLGNESKAIHEWRNLICPAAGMSSEEGRKHLLGQLSDRAQNALRLVGGMPKVEQCEEKFLFKLEQEFIKIFCQAPTNLKVLPPAKLQPVPVAAMEERRAPSSEPINLNKFKRDDLRQVLERGLKLASGEVSKDQSWHDALCLKGWVIDQNRFQFFLETVEDKQSFFEQFKFLVNRKGRSPAASFDELTGFKSRIDYDPKAVADEWLKDVDF